MRAFHPEADLARNSRSVLPADGWFEWQKRGAGKAPRFLSSADKKATPRPSMR